MITDAEEMSAPQKAGAGDVFLYAWPSPTFPGGSRKLAVAASGAEPRDRVQVVLRVHDSIEFHTNLY